MRTEAIDESSPSSPPPAPNYIAMVDEDNKKVRVHIPQNGVYACNALDFLLLDSSRKRVGYCDLMLNCTCFLFV